MCPARMRSRRSSWRACSACSSSAAFTWSACSGTTRSRLASPSCRRAGDRDPLRRLLGAAGHAIRREARPPGRPSPDRRRAGPVREHAGPLHLHREPAGADASARCGSWPLLPVFDGPGHVERDPAGLRACLRARNTSLQVGGALGLAVLATLSATRTDNLLASGSSQDAALTGGFQLAFWIGAGLVAAAIAVTALVVQTPAAQPELVEAPQDAEAERAYSEAA